MLSLLLLSSDWLLSLRVDVQEQILLDFKSIPFLFMKNTLHLNYTFFNWSIFSFSKLLFQLCMWCQLSEQLWENFLILDLWQFQGWKMKCWCSDYCINYQISFRKWQMKCFIITLGFIVIKNIIFLDFWLKSLFLSDIKKTCTCISVQMTDKINTTTFAFWANNRHETQQTETLMQASFMFPTFTFSIGIVENNQLWLGNYWLYTRLII